MAQRRTTHRSSKGTKLYAVRKADGTFADVQTYKRAHGADVRRRAKGEQTVAGKVAKAAKKTVKRAAAAGGSMLRKARKAVGGALKKVTAKKATKRAAKKRTRKATA